MTALAATPPRGYGADLVDSARFGEMVGIGRVHTIRSLCRDDLVPGASKIGHEWKIHFATFYAALAGPGVPVGRVVKSRELARLLGPDISDRVVRRASAPPGTAGKLPGLRLGKVWLYAVPAVQLVVGWPLADPGSTAAGPPGVVFLPPALDYPGGTAPQSPVAPGRARASRPAASRTTRPGRNP